MDGIDQIVLSLTARGLTTGEVAAHFAEVYDAKVSKDTVSRITDTVVEEMTEWCNRRPVYVVIGVTVNGERDILGLWFPSTTN